MRGLSGSFPTNPHDKPPYWISVGIGAAYVMRPSWSLSCYRSYKNEGNKEKIRPLKNLVPAWKNKYIITVFELLLTPPNTPLKYLFTAVLIMVMPKDTLSKNLLNIWEYKFKSV